MKKILIGIVILIGLGLIFLGIQKEKAQSNQSTSGKEVVKIGVIAPLTGDMSVFGQDYKRGIELAMENLPKDSKYEYKFFFEDDQLQTKSALSIAQKLIQVNGVDILFSTYGGPLHAVTPLAEKNKVILGHVSWNSELSKENAHNFSHITQPDDIQKKLVQAMIDRKYNNIAIVATLTSEDPIVYMTEAVKGTDVKIVESHSIPSGTKDFKMLVQKLKALDVDAYYVVLYQPELDVFIKEWNLNGNDKPLLSSGVSPSTSKYKELLEGIVISDNALPDDKFYDMFTKRFGVQTEGVAPFTYEMINVLHTIYEKHPQKPSTDVVMQDLVNLKDFKGIFGEIKVGQDRIIRTNPSLKTLRGGKMEVLEK